MMRHIILIGLFFICFSTNALTITDQRSWEEGALSWNDFKGNPMIKNQSAYLSAELLQDNQIISTGNRESFSISAKAVMYPYQSYAQSLVATPRRSRSNYQARTTAR